MTMHVHVCLWFIITLPIVIKPLGYYYPFMALQQRRMRQDGLGVLSIPGYSCPKAISLTKINIDEDLTHSNIKVFKLTLNDKQWDFQLSLSKPAKRPFLNIHILAVKPLLLSEKRVIAG